MPTKSFSLDEKTKQIIEDMAQEQGKSQSAVIRDAIKSQKLMRSLHKIQKEVQPQLRELGLETADDFEEYLG